MPPRRLSPAVSTALMALGVVAVAGGFVGYRYQRYRAPLAAFKGKVGRFLSFPKLERAADTTYAKGRIAVIDKTKGELDELHLDLPDDLRAGTPDEVKTVVWLESSPRRNRNAYYTNGAIGYDHVCRVTVIDATIPAVVAERELVTPPPGVTIDGKFEQVGTRPDLEIRTFLVRGLKRVP